MRVLFVLHDYLPGHPSGVEVHTAELAARLAERGHEVEVFCTEKDVGRPHLALERREHEGIAVHELVNNLFYEDFRETWDWPEAQRVFGELLDRLRPDVVHVMHLMYLSVGCVEEAARRGIPVLFTLHDFWLECARFGQLVHADESICHTVDFARCGTCLAELKWAQTPLQRRLARGIARLRAATGIDLSGAARGAAELFAREPRGARAPGQGLGQDEPRAREYARAMAERDRGLRERLVPRVDRFLAPSRFLRDRLVAWGLSEERVVLQPYGIELAPFAGFERRPSDRTRVAFVGTLAPHKAPHLLLEAWKRLPAELRARARLTLHGPKRHHPAYVARLERLAGEVGAALPGALARADVPEALRSIDLLVVPSAWYENSPLILHEARATRTPALVSDLGGMAELVEPGVSGWRFRPGDAEDLARALARVLADPGELARLTFAGAEAKDVRASAAEHEELYRDALAARAGASREAEAS